MDIGLPPKSPLRRHPALQPLSRQHHQILLLGQYLRDDVPDYPGYPTDLDDRIAFTRQRFRDLIFPHFELEENTLLPAVHGYAAELDKLGDALLAEHRAIREALDAVAAADREDARALLDTLGRLLIAHIRREERSWFETIQRIVPGQALADLDFPSRTA